MADYDDCWDRGILHRNKFLLANHYNRGSCFNDMKQDSRLQGKERLLFDRSLQSKRARVVEGEKEFPSWHHVNLELVRQIFSTSTRSLMALNHGERSIKRSYRANILGSLIWSMLRINQYSGRRDDEDSLSV